MAELRNLTYDGERIFPPGCKFPPRVQAAARKLKMWELRWLLIEEQGAFEVTHSEYKPPSKALYKRAGKELVEFLGHYYDQETGKLWMEGA